MTDILDYRTLGVVFVLKSFLQALGLLYVWYVDRKYPPARKWAVGSLFFAVGTLLALAQPETSSVVAVFGRNVLVYAGVFIFGVGIMQACATQVPWRLFGALTIAGLAGQFWYTVHTPSISARIAVFSLTVGIGEAYMVLRAFQAPAGPLRGAIRIVGVLLAMESAAALFRGVSALQTDFTSVLQRSPEQTVFILISIGASFLIALALAVLTGQRTTAVLAAVLDNLDQGVAMFDKDKRLVICNARYGQLYGLQKDQLRPGTSLKNIVARRVANGIYAGANPDDYFKERNCAAVEASTKLQRLNDGRSIVVSRRPLRFGGWLTTHADVTAVQRIEAQIAYLAHHDSLTGLANRQLFSEQLQEALVQLGENGKSFAILLVDVDHFKTINDTLGHPTGDALLMAFAQRLRHCVADGDVVARLGGDEFAILQRTAADKTATMRLVTHLLDGVGAAYDLHGQKVKIGTSIGIARAPENGTDADKLMRHADLALYRAKAEGRNCYRFFDEDMDAKARARHALELALRTAITCNDFLLEYQPVVDVLRHQTCGAEALVRWRHPAGKVIEPSKFINIAEETGLIIPLGEWILRRACTDAVAWPNGAKVSVNLSPAQFADGGLCEMIETVLDQTGLPPTRLELEVTESVILHSNETSLAILRRLKQRGVSITLDSFGSGYSSLNYLIRFPFDRIKIDRSFVTDLGHRQECLAIVTAIVGVARSLTMATTVEGVETLEQYELLRAAGCTQMQGYLFGKPCPFEHLAFTRWEPPARHVA